MVESQPSKLLVAGSIPVSRSTAHRGTAVVVSVTQPARESNKLA
jgi:hypothetical protein